MITYDSHTLANGLRVVVNRDPDSAMAAVNLLYAVGARNESPDCTGFAHLFEHLMFRGTRDVPDFDAPLQLACGENNAFTNNDYTDYYITLPKDNIETALWLESDRMRGLDISDEVLETEKRVVLEEYNQRYLNQPYGDMWKLLRGMCYTTHPYRWPTIGLTPDHIRDASMTTVRRFYDRYYSPENCILSVSSGHDPEHIFAFADKWFSHIPATGFTRDTIPTEPLQTSARRLEVERDVPATAIMIAFPMGDRLSRNYYLCDMLTDVLAGGTSARLYQRLVKGRRLMGATNAYITGDVDPGLLVVTANLLPETSVAEAEQALWEELRELATNAPSDYELTKIKNKFEAEMTYGEMNIMNKAMNLGYYSMLGDLPLINREAELFRSITRSEICAAAAEMFRPERSSTLIYAKKK
ncbi:MAG: insulinase family protein [Rikenellaceae bacterium]|nr:insulinase family protein [Rikenellaceae bacterium]